MKYNIYLSLGSNIGNRKNNICAAIELLKNIIKDTHISDYFLTKPRDFLNQPDFLNIVLKGFYSHSPFDLLEKIKIIEIDIGRKRPLNLQKGPRTIDIDILLFDDKIINSKELILPHPEIIKRKFVLIPMLELNPHLKNPINGKNYIEYLFQLEEQGIYYFSLDRYNDALKNN